MLDQIWGFEGDGGREGQDEEGQWVLLWNRDPYCHGLRAFGRDALDWERTSVLCGPFDRSMGRRRGNIPLKGVFFVLIITDFFVSTNSTVTS